MGSEENPYVTQSDMKKMLNSKFYEIDLKKIEKIFLEVAEGLRSMTMGKLKEVLKEGVGVDDAVIRDIAHAAKVTGSGDNALLEWRSLLDLYSRVTFGVSYGSSKD